MTKAMTRGKIVNGHTHFPPVVHERLCERAKKNRRTLSSEILFIVEQALEADTQQVQLQEQALAQ